MEMIADIQAKVLMALRPSYEMWKDARLQYLNKIRDLKGSDYNAFRIKLQDGDISKKDNELIMWSREEVVKKVQKEYERKLSEVSELIAHKLKGVEVKTVDYQGWGEYDITLIINKERSFTINTVFAGGHNIQCLHVRTLIKLHKGIV